MRFTGWLLISSLLFAIGCSASGPSSGWVQAHGGLVADCRQARAQAALARLVSGHPEIHAVVHVLNSDTIAAYSWPNGHIFVTAGLIDLAGPDELTAALAHEFGHLAADGHMHVVASLRGCDRDRDVEVRADAVGMELLRLQGLSPDSMIQLLEKVQASAALPAPCHGAIGARIDLLRHRVQQH